MRPANNGSAMPATLPVEKLSPTQLRKLRQDPHKLAVFHQTSSSGVDKRLILEGVSASLMSMMSPYCKNEIEAKTVVHSAAGLPVDVKKTSIIITGGNHQACQAFIKFMSDYCDDTEALHEVLNPKILGYIRLHEIAEVLGIDMLTGWAIGEIEGLLQTVLPSEDLLAVLKRFLSGSYVDMLVENAAYCISNWLGDYSEDCQFVETIKEYRPSFAAQVQTVVNSMNAEREAEWTEKFKALCEQDDKARAREERKRKQTEKKQKKAEEERMNQQQNRRRARAGRREPQQTVVAQGATVTTRYNWA